MTSQASHALHVINFTDIRAPAPVTVMGEGSAGFEIEYPWDAEAIPSSTTVVLADTAGRTFHVIDVADPANPAVVGTWYR